MFCAACSWVVSKSMCWRARLAYAPVTRAPPPARRVGLHAHAPARGSEAERDPVERDVAADLGALGAEDPAALRQRLAAHVAQPRAVADDELGDRVEDAVGSWWPTGIAPRPPPARPLRGRPACAGSSSVGSGLHGASGSARSGRRRAGRRRTRPPLNWRRCARRTRRRRGTTEPRWRRTSSSVLDCGLLDRRDDARRRAALPRLGGERARRSVRRGDAPSTPRA